MSERKPVFYDEEQRRWRRTRRVLELAGVLFTVVLVTFFITIAQRVDLPGLLLPSGRTGLHAVLASAKSKQPPRRRGRIRRVAALGQVPAKYDPLRVAFYVSWDPNSLASLKLHYRDIDLLVPEQLHAVSADGQLDLESDPKLDGWMQSLGLEIPTMPLLNNSDGTIWHVPEMAAMLHHPAARQRLVQELVAHVVDAGQAGIVLDFEQVPDKSQRDFRSFVGELEAGLHGADLKLMVALPAADWAYDYAAVSRECDAIVLMNYDDHWLTSAPGPIAPQDWFVTNIEKMLKLVPREKIVMGIANYAYDWPDAKGRAAHEVASPQTFQEAIVTSSESEAPVEYDADSLNPHYSYYDEHDHVHQVWMLDGVTAYNELRAAERAGVRGTALWRMGTEDPSLWSIWDLTKPDDVSRGRLAEMPPGYDLILEGEGDIWRITATPQKGQRTFRFDSATNTIVDENYVSIPLSYRIEQLGALHKKIALSFDDGPDPQNTPQILDILKAKHAPATFFVIGSNANQYLGLLQREYAEGHEIGNHTYTHPRNERDFQAAAGARVKSHRTPFRQHAGRQDAAFPPALRHRSSARNRRRSVRAADSAVHGLSAGRRAPRSTRLGRTRRRASSPCLGNRPARRRTGPARRGQYRSTSRWRRESPPHHRSSAGHHRRFARGRLRLGARFRSDWSIAGPGNAPAQFQRAYAGAHRCSDFQPLRMAAPGNGLDLHRRHRAGQRPRPHHRPARAGREIARTGAPASRFRAARHRFDSRL